MHRDSRRHVVGAGDGDMQQQQQFSLWGRPDAVQHTAVHVSSTAVAGALDRIIRRQLMLQLRMCVSQACVSQVCIRVASHLYHNTASAIALPSHVGQGSQATTGSSSHQTLTLLLQGSIVRWVSNSKSLATYLKFSHDLDLLSQQHESHSCNAMPLPQL